MIREIDSEEVYSKYFASLAFATLPQSWAWGEAKRTQGWTPRRFLVERNGDPVALFQVLWKHRFIARINRGPLFFSETPSDLDIRETDKAIRRITCFPHGIGAFIAPIQQPKGRYFRWQKKSWRSALVDLRQDEDTLKKRLDQGWRRALKKALNSPLKLEQASIEWMIDRHEENMQAKAFKGHGRAFVRALAKCADHTILAASLDEELVAGMLLVRFGRFAEYFIGWFGEKGRKFNGGNFLYWHAFAEMKGQGSEQFDVGGYTIDDRYGRFKAGINGSVYTLPGEWVAF